jgi:hypothetical protein
LLTSIVWLQEPRFIFGVVLLRWPAVADAAAA